MLIRRENPFVAPPGREHHMNIVHMVSPDWLDT
jgi:hypothetical protein